MKDVEEGVGHREYSNAFHTQQKKSNDKSKPLTFLNMIHLLENNTFPYRGKRTYKLAQILIMHNSERKELNLENLEEMKSFKPLAVIVHGFSASANMSWVRKLETALLKKEDTNVISVDWQKGATGPNYLQAIANLRIVGAQISSLLSQIRPTGDVHLIGQSLGAHLVSYVRVNMKTVSYITGLDPAQPWFTNKSPAVKLDRTDADFVDVIHTDSKLSWPQLGLGMAEPAGHVDFYINGGFSQPGCKRNEKGFMEFIGNHLSSAIHNVACSHMRASEYLIEALDSTCSFWGIKWNITERCVEKDFVVLNNYEPFQLKLILTLQWINSLCDLKPDVIGHQPLNQLL
uniref:Lipase domain-containing protein n=1 Tax=Rhodnius prolixus TaxID=13249 RepID=T1HDD7_RHOPR